MAPLPQAAPPAAPSQAPRATGRWVALARRLAPPLVGLALLALIPSLFDSLFGFSANFQLHRVSLIGIFVLAAFAQNVLTGYAAQPSLGNAAFFGVGGYLLAWISGDLGHPFWVGIVAGILVSAALGVVVGGPALRVSGAYLAIATLGLVFIAGALFDVWDTTAGRQSYEILTMPAILSDDHAFYFIVLAVVAVVLTLGHFLLRSRIGRAWVALRDSEAAAQAFGINLTRYKLLAFVLSASLTGLAGALYATWASTASASMSGADQTILFLAMIVVGGLGSITGSVLGAIFVGMVPLLLGTLPSPMTVGPLQIQVSTLNAGIYGLLLLLALIFFPAGLASIPASITRLVRRVARAGGAQ